MITVVYNRTEVPFHRSSPYSGPSNSKEGNERGKHLEESREGFSGAPKRGGYRRSELAKKSDKTVFNNESGGTQRSPRKMRKSRKPRQGTQALPTRQYMGVIWGNFVPGILRETIDMRT